MRLRIACCTFLIFAIVPSALADKLPPRSVRERAFADQIKKAGHACPQVRSFEAWDDAEAMTLRAQRLVTNLVRCSNGRVYGVANPQSRKHARASSPPVDPVVKRRR